MNEAATEERRGDGEGKGESEVVTPGGGQGKVPRLSVECQCQWRRVGGRLGCVVEKFVLPVWSDDVGHCLRACPLAISRISRFAKSNSNRR